MSTEILDTISSPADLSGLSYEELDELAFELRARLVATTSVRGGHLAPSLGAVELIIALHRVLDCPKDRIVFDVGHQAYAHKLLTGRKDRFNTLRSYGGISGFPKIDESPYDSHDSGHASDSLSIALGYALARDLDGGDETIAALIGDASFTGGMAMEALNNIGHSRTRLIIVLNDNGMSISPNVGGFAAHLAKVRMSRRYVDVRDQVEDAFNSSGKVGRLLMKGGNVVKESVKQFVLPGDTFLEGFGLTYIGPVDGHDIEMLETIFRDAKQMNGPVVIHAVTTKGKGYAPAEKHPDLFHGVSPFDISTGKMKKKPDAAPSWTSVFSDELVKLAAEDSDIVAITAAMASGTGLKAFAKAYPGRFVDVGIAEEHAVTFSAALAASGAKPIFGVYGAFLQRAYDELWHDLCLNRAPATIINIGSSVFGANAETHLNFFDLAMLGGLPNLRVLAPTCLEEYLAMLDWSLDQQDMPVVIRMPIGSPTSRPKLASTDYETFGTPSYQVVREGADVAILALGGFFSLGEQVTDALAQHGVQATLVNPRFATELDEDFLRTLPERHRVVITLEDGVLEGGWGEKVARFLATTDVHTRCYGIPRNFYDRFDPQELLASCGITVEGIANDTLKLLRV